jgi:phosphate:Na+ symporter
MNTPAFAVQRATEVTATMAEISTKALISSLDVCEKYDAKLAEEIRDLENKADILEDALGTYLIKSSALDIDERDSRQITKLLHLIGDFERISDHAVNILESAEEIKDKKISFSKDAQRELGVLRSATREILTAASEAYIGNDLARAADVEPLEQVVDDLRDRIKLNHILRLQKSECTIELGFVLSDLLTNYERVSDHCSNIAVCLIQISKSVFDAHEYLNDYKTSGSEVFTNSFDKYKKQFILPE